MSRVAVPIALSPQAREELQRRARAQRVEHRHRQGARVVLLAAEGWSNDQIAPRVGFNVNSVRKWRTPLRPGRPGGLGR
jgi:DNA-binding NarL/FixJ family response regulator